MPLVNTLDMFKKAYAGGYYTNYLPTTAESRLVYPLEIETQRVALLEQSIDGKYILLVIVENGRFVLLVLDSTDYHLVQQLDIDAAEEHAAHVIDERLAVADLLAAARGYRGIIAAALG